MRRASIDFRKGSGPLTRGQERSQARMETGEVATNSQETDPLFLNLIRPLIARNSRSYYKGLYNPVPRLRFLQVTSFSELISYSLKVVIIVSCTKFVSYTELNLAAFPRQSLALQNPV